jgi:hypothetical protein
MMIEMNRRRILRQQRKPDVVGRRDRSSQRMLIDIPNLEILVEPTGPTLFDRHRYALTPGPSSNSGREETYYSGVLFMTVVFGVLWQRTVEGGK